MTAAWLKGERAQFERIMQKGFDLMAIIALPMIFGAYFLADTIMTVVAGSEFAIGGNILRLLIIAASTIYLGTIFSHGVIALDKQKNIIGAYALVAVTSLAGYFILIPRFSYYGAASVTIYSELAIAIASIIIVWRGSGFLPTLNVAAKSFLASLAMSAGLYLLPSLNLALSIVFGGTVYIAALFVFKGVTKQDLLEIMNKS
jgi:O-antigen/teichoic acid export membrane protein